MSGEQQTTDRDAHPRLSSRRIPLAIVAAALVAIAVVGEVVFTRMSDHRYRERSATLARNLAVMRSAISTYRQKHGSGPARLGDLVSDGELRRVPVDPITGSDRTWRVVREEEVRLDDFARSERPAARPPTIEEVHSGAPGKDRSGKAWAEY
jgi:general secretion pathway protein G